MVFDFRASYKISFQQSTVSGSAVKAE